MLRICYSGKWDNVHFYCSIYKHIKRAAILNCLRDKAKIALVFNFYFDLRPPGQIPGLEERKPGSMGQLECANRSPLPGGGDGQAWN